MIKTTVRYYNFFFFYEWWNDFEKKNIREEVFCSTYLYVPTTTYLRLLTNDERKGGKINELGLRWRIILFSHIVFLQPLWLLVPTYYYV